MFVVSFCGNISQHTNCHDITEILLKVALNTINLNLPQHTISGNVGLNIFNWPISDELTRSLGIEAGQRGVAQFVNIFNCLAMIGWSEMNERLPDLTLHRMLLDISVSQKSRWKRYNKHLILIWLKYIFDIYLEKCRLHLLQHCHLFTQDGQLNLSALNRMLLLMLKEQLFLC